MKSTSFVLLAAILCISANSLAQPFDIGHTSIVFYDSDRNRDIETEIYYPADSAGEEASVALGNFPVIIFGHGFLMSWESYENFWMELVPEGYVLCFPTTEMSFTPSHQDFGLDLQFVATQMQNENEDISSLLFNALAPKTALMGHSMGGGASFLGAENEPTISTLINFAAAETNPSAISAALDITIPTLIFSGNDDCVTPPDQNQSLMYSNLASECKTHIRILNGGHCYFADDDFNCTLGESFCGSTLDITREEQQAITFEFLKLWLNYSLNDDNNALIDFNDSLQSSTQIDFSQSCNTTSVQDLAIISDPIFYPNPATDELRITISKEITGGILFIYDLMGRQVYQDRIVKTNDQIDLSNIARGTYLLIYSKDTFNYSRRLLKL
jgi:pimeloyl-ACP methyl ester carboxylesterase